VYKRGRTNNQRGKTRSWRRGRRQSGTSDVYGPDRKPRSLPLSFALVFFALSFLPLKLGRLYRKRVLITRSGWSMPHPILTRRAISWMRERTSRMWVSRLYLILFNERHSLPRRPNMSPFRFSGMNKIVAGKAICRSLNRATTKREYLAFLFRMYSLFSMSFFFLRFLLQ